MENPKRSTYVVTKGGQRVEVAAGATPQQIAELMDFIGKRGRVRASNVAQPTPPDGTQIPYPSDPSRTPKFEPRPTPTLTQGFEEPDYELLSKLALEERSVAPAEGTDPHLNYGFDPSGTPENLPSLPLQPSGSEGNIFNFKPTPRGLSAVPSDLVNATVGAVGEGLNKMQDAAPRENIPVSQTGKSILDRAQAALDFYTPGTSHAPDAHATLEFISGIVGVGFGAATAVNPFLRALTTGSSIISRTGEEFGTELPGKIVHGVMAPVTAATSPETESDAMLTGLADVGLLMGASGYRLAGNGKIAGGINRGLDAVERFNPAKPLAYPGLRVENSIRKTLGAESLQERGLRKATELSWWRKKQLDDADWVRQNIGDLTPVDQAYLASKDAPKAPSVDTEGLPPAEVGGVASARVLPSGRLRIRDSEKRTRAANPLQIGDPGKASPDVVAREIMDAESAGKIKLTDSERRELYWMDQGVWDDPNFYRGKAGREQAKLDIDRIKEILRAHNVDGLKWESRFEVPGKDQLADAGTAAAKLVDKITQGDSASELAALIHGRPELDVAKGRSKEQAEALEIISAFASGNTDIHPRLASDPRSVAKAAGATDADADAFAGAVTKMMEKWTPGSTSEQGFMFARALPKSPLKRKKVSEEEGVSGMSQAGEEAIRRGQYERVTEDATPDAVLQGVGGVPTSYDAKAKVLRVGNDAEIHYDFLVRHYLAQGLPKDKAIMRAQTEMRNSKFPSARITPDKKFVAIWGSSRDHKQQDISNMLFDMVRGGHLKKDALVSFSSKGQQFTVQEAIEGTAPGFVGARLGLPLKKFVERDKKNPAFVKWFGESQLKEADGSPKIMFHGSTSPSGIEKTRTADPFQLGFHVGSLGQAQDRIDYLTGKTDTNRNEQLIPLYVRAENPIRLKDLGTWQPDMLAGELLEHPNSGRLSGSTRKILNEIVDRAMDGDPNFTDSDAWVIVDAIKEMGHDSVVYKNEGEVSDANDLSVAAKKLMRSARQEIAGLMGGLDQKTNSAFERISKFVDGRRFEVADDVAMGESKNSGDAEVSRVFKALATDLGKLKDGLDAKLEDSYILLDPNQVKSVTGNRGTFSRTDPSILKAKVLPDAESFGLKKKKGEIDEPGILREDFSVEHEGLGTHEALKKNIESLNERGVEPVSAKTSQDRALERFAAATHDLIRERVTEEGPDRTSWYQKHGQLYIPKVAQDKPELKLDDPSNREMFALLGSVLSNGNSVRQEVQKQIQYFGDYLKKGKFNPRGDFGARNASIAASLQKMNKLLKHFGSPEEMMRWMDSKHSVGEINSVLKAAGVNATVENVGGRGVEQYGATVLGPKVGNYQLNKLGNESVVTKDSWMARLWDVVMADYNPVTKKLFDGRGDSFKQEQMRGMGEFSVAERRTMDEAFRRAADELKLTPADVQAVLWGEIKKHTAKQIGDDPGLGSHIDFYERSAQDAGLREGNAGKTGQPEATGKAADVWGDAPGAGESDAGSGSGGGYAFAKAAPKLGIKRKKDPKYAGSVNVDRLAGLSKEQRKRVMKLAERLKPELTRIIGDDLTFDEIIEAAASVEPWGQVIPRGEKTKVIAQTLKLRQIVNYNIQHDVTTEMATQQMKELQSIANFAGSLLGSFRIDAEGVDWGIKQQLYSRLQNLNHDMQAVIDAGRSVNFNDARQVAEFYRQFVKPKTSEVLDELRYISLLSSPRTHIVNAFSNITQTLGLAPATRAVHAATDWATSKVTGKNREVFMSEVPAYTRGALDAIPQAWSGAVEAFLGRKAISQLDLKRVPSVGEAANPLMKPISKLNDATRFVLNSLEAGDVFFREMVKAGEVRALVERAEQLGKTPDMAAIEKQAEETAAYFVFRKPLDPGNETQQGKLLSQIDKITNGFQTVSANVPSLRWIVPFVQTPMNIFKQGIEYSPLGFATMKGAGANKSLQFSKALVGSIVAMGAAQIVSDAETTWDIPENESEKADFYAQGKQPFSIKIGDKWMQITKLGPLAYPIAMAMMAKHSGKDGESAIVALPISMIKFLSEQSYMQGLQSLGDAIKEPERFASKFATSMGRQVIPLGSLQRFANNFIDRSQRAPETMMDRMVVDMPGLSKTVPERVTPFGETAKKPDLLVNLFQLSPLNATRATHNRLIQDLERRGITVGVPSRKVYGNRLSQDDYNKYVREVGQRFVETFGEEGADWLSQDEVDRLLITIRHEVRSEMFPDLEEEFIERQDEEQDQ